MQILTYPKDVKALREVAAPLTKEMLASDEFKTKLAEMTEIAKKDGIGLAATQVGWPVQLFIILVDRNLDKTEPYVVINPKITEESDDLVKAPEGCLSFPGLDGLNPVRPKKIRFTWQTLDGENHTMLEEFVKGTYWGFFIRVLQHETDHLNGKTLIDRIAPEEQHLVDKWLKLQKS